MKVRVKKINAFTESLNGGNPAGVVTNPQNLTEENMKTITREIAVSESAFVFPSAKADFKLRFFSPAIEVDLCGHATIATFFTMAEEGLFPKKNGQIIITQETNAGILPVDIYFRDDKCEKVMMTQGKPVLKDREVDIGELAESLHIQKNEIDDSLPQQIVSTGLFTLPICVTSFDTLQQMSPNFDHIKKMCNQVGVGSFHVFTFETLEKTSVYHARNFAPVYGINEDPVTGTANGAVSSYLMKNGLIEKRKIVCEQGDIIGRPGRVFVDLDNDVVKVGGKTRLVEEKEVEIE